MEVWEEGAKKDFEVKLSELGKTCIENCIVKRGGVKIPEKAYRSAVTSLPHVPSPHFHLPLHFLLVDAVRLFLIYPCLSIRVRSLRLEPKPCGICRFDHPAILTDTQFTTYTRGGFLNLADI